MTQEEKLRYKSQLRWIPLSLLLMIAWVVLAQSAFGQSPQLKKSDFLKPPTDKWKPFTGKLSIASTAVCFGGASADIISSQGLQERNAFFRDSSGRLDNRKALLTFIPCGASYAVEKKYPKAAILGRFVYGGVKTYFAIRNWNVHRGMK